jgi:hypothetical protein
MLIAVPDVVDNNYRLILGAVFLVIKWMQARQYIHGQVDWNRVGNDSRLQSLSAQVSSTHILGKKTASNFIQQIFGTRIEFF